MSALKIEQDVNDRIKDIRDKYSLKQQNIANITGYSVSTIKKWMMGKEQKHYSKAPVQALKILENWASKGGELVDVNPLDDNSHKISDVWSILNFKGGVGKTTVAFNFSLMLSKKAKVLAVDCDPQGHLSSSLIQNPNDLKFSTSDLLEQREGIPFQVNENLDVIGTDNSLANTCEAIPASDLLFLLKENLDKYKSTYDYIIIDSLPSKGALYDSILAASNKIIVPFTADLYDSWGLQDVFQQVKKVKLRKINENIKVAALIPNRVERPFRNFDQAVLDSVSKSFPLETCPYAISNSVRLKECKSPAVSKAIVDYAPNDRVSQEYTQVLDFIKNSERN